MLDLVGVRRRDLILRGPVALLENDWAYCEYSDYGEKIAAHRQTG